VRALERRSAAGASVATRRAPTPMRAAVYGPFGSRLLLGQWGSSGNRFVAGCCLCRVRAKCAEWQNRGRERCGIEGERVEESAVTRRAVFPGFRGRGITRVGLFSTPPPLPRRLIGVIRPKRLWHRVLRSAATGRAVRARDRPCRQRPFYGCLVLKRCQATGLSGRSYRWLRPAGRGWSVSWAGE